MMDFVAKFSGPANLVVDFCTGTIAVGKECMLMSEHQGIVACDMNEDCVEEAFPCLVEIYMQQLVSSESNLPLNEETCDAARVFFAGTDEIQAGGKEDIWSVPTR